MVTAADIIFNVDRHEYSVPDGRIVPGVTAILRHTGVSVDFDALPGREGIERRRDIGTALHADSHALCDGDLDWSTVHPDVLPFLESWATCREHKRLVPLTRERRVFDPTLWYAGTLDGIFLIETTGKRVLIDLCIGDATAAAKQYQTAAYQRAYELDHPDTVIDERWAVELRPGQRVPYGIQPYTEWSDFQIWPAIVTTYSARPTARRSVAA